MFTTELTEVRLYLEKYQLSSSTAENNPATPIPIAHIGSENYKLRLLTTYCDKNITTIK